MSVKIDFRWAMDGYRRSRIRTIKDVEYKPGSTVCHLKYEKGMVDNFGMIVEGCSVEPGDVITNLETGEKLTANMTGEEKYKRIKAWLDGEDAITIEVEDIIL